LLEGALDPSAATLPALGRTGAWPTDQVRTVTTVLLLRLRFKLTVHGRRERLLLVEEAGTLALEANHDAPSLAGEAARALLEHPASGDLAPIARDRLLTQARDRVRTALQTTIADYARERARELADDHARVRSAAGVPRVSVEPVLPPDVIGLYVLLPGKV
jgi:hypothetical protein